MVIRSYYILFLGPGPIYDWYIAILVLTANHLHLSLRPGLNYFSTISRSLISMAQIQFSQYFQINFIHDFIKSRVFQLGLDPDCCFFKSIIRPQAFQFILRLNFTYNYNIIRFKSLKTKLILRCFRSLGVISEYLVH